MQESAHGYLVVRDIPAPAFSLQPYAPSFPVSVGGAAQSAVQNRQMSGSIHPGTGAPVRAGVRTLLLYTILPTMQVLSFPARRRKFFSHLYQHTEGVKCRNLPPGCRTPPAARTACPGSGACTVRRILPRQAKRYRAAVQRRARHVLRTSAVHAVARQRMPPGREMHTDLMCAPRDGHHPQQPPPPPPPCQHPVFRAAGLPPAAHAPLNDGPVRQRNGRVDGALLPVHQPLGHGIVHFLHRGGQQRRGHMFIAYSTAGRGFPCPAGSPDGTRPRVAPIRPRKASA